MSISVNIGSSNHDQGIGGRRHRRSRPATPLGTMIGGVVIVAVAFGVYFALEAQAQRISQVLSEGQRAEATVEGVRERERVRTDDEGRTRRSTNYYISLRYETSDGRELTISDKRVSRSIFNAASRSDTIKVAFSPDDPSNPVFPEHESGESQSWIAYIVGIIGAILAFFGFGGWQRQRKQGAQGQAEDDVQPELREQDESQAL